MVRGNIPNGENVQEMEFNFYTFYTNCNFVIQKKSKRIGKSILFFNQLGRVVKQLLSFKTNIGK